MVDVLSYLKHTKNTLIGNPSAKLALKRTSGPEGPLLPSIVSYVNYNPVLDGNAGASSSTEPSAAQIRTEAANVVASLAHGPREVLFGLLEADAPSAILTALAALSEHDPTFLKIAIVRALRALFVAIADCAGPSLWELGEECLEFRSETRSTLDYIYQTQALDVYLPLLESPTSTIKLYIAQLLAFGVRIPKHRIAITDWLPPAERVKEIKGKRGWEVSALVDANSPGRQGGWVVRQLAGMLKSRDFVQQETALYAIAALVKDNPNVALLLSRSATEQKAFTIKASHSILSIASELARGRKTEVRLAACLCITNILRSINSVHDRRLSSTIIHVLSTIVSNINESALNRAKACHILSWLVADDGDRCLDASKSGTLDKLADVVRSITPTSKPREWEDGEAIDTSRLREASLTAIASLAMIVDDIRNDVAGRLGLLPFITVCLEHPSPGIRYAACQCVRALSRAVRVLRTSIVDAGVAATLCEIVEKRDEDRRVTNIALTGLCNLVNDFSPLREMILNRGMVPRIAELTRAPEDKLKITALWAVKNLLNGANSDEKDSVMKQVGWDHLRSCLVDSKEDVQEQALNLVANIASSIEDITMLLDHIAGDDLLDILAGAMDSPSEDVILQSIKVTNNLANHPSTSLTLTTHHRILRLLSKSLLHHRFDTRYASIGCIELLARTNAGKLRDFGMDNALREVLRIGVGMGVNAGGLGSGPGIGVGHNHVGVGGGLEAEGRRRSWALASSASSASGANNNIASGGLGTSGGEASSDQSVVNDGGIELRSLVESALRALGG